jgi:hypothetical protein
MRLRYVDINLKLKNDFKNLLNMIIILYKMIVKIKNFFRKIIKNNNNFANN